MKAYYEALFHTGWFVESILTQTLIVHVIRTRKIPFIQSRASPVLSFFTLLIMGVAAYLPYSPLAASWASCRCRPSTGPGSPASSCCTASSPTS